MAWLVNDGRETIEEPGVSRRMSSRSPGPVTSDEAQLRLPVEIAAAFWAAIDGHGEAHHRGHAAVAAGVPPKMSTIVSATARTIALCLRRTRQSDVTSLSPVHSPNEQRKQRPRPRAASR